jgi:Short C-terminal domain
MQPRNSSRFWFIPGFQQLHKGQTIPGIAWLVGTLLGYSIGLVLIGVIIHGVYIYLYCKNEIRQLFNKKSQSKTVEESFDFPYAKNTIGCMVSLIDDYVIRKKGKSFQFLNFFDQDANNVKIPVESITCVNYKASGILDGTLEFVYMGFVPKLNQVKHAQENVITFRGEECNKKFWKFKELVEKRMREMRRESLNPQKSSTSDELSKLSDLYQKGVLTKEEFIMQKKKLLGM